jgi:outer membrane receptor protein involved in Fe transport
LLQNAGPSPLYLEDRATLVRTYAGFGEATLSPISRLHFTLGARWSWSDTSVLGQVTAQDGIRTTNTARTDSRLAPKAVVSFDLNQSTVLYGQASEGYRGGGVNTSGLASQVFAATGHGTQPNLYYEGDELVNYEFGVKSGLWDGRLRLRAAAFFDRWSRLQTNQLLPSGLGYVANIGVAGNYGIEIEAAARPNENLELGANLTLNDPELGQPDPTFGGGRDIPLPGVSRVSAGASALQRFALPYDLKGDAAFEAAYVGRSRVSVDATTNAAMGGYTTARLSVGVARDHWKVRLVLDNLADRAANTFAFGNPFSIRTQGQITPLRPRSLTLRLSASF